MTTVKKWSKIAIVVQSPSQLRRKPEVRLVAALGKTSQSPVAERRVDKFAARREQLAEAAIQTLATLGYARTSLRDIAQNSELSHGSLHYYFEDKVDLILCCVRQYKQACIRDYDQLMEACHTAEEVRFGFAGALVASVRDEGWLHRLWYDLRNQSLFEEQFRAAVLDIDSRLEQVIWRVVTQYADYSGAVTKVDPHLAYSTFDGLFLRALLHHLGGRDDALDTLHTNATGVMLTMIKRP